MNKTAQVDFMAVMQELNRPKDGPGVLLASDNLERCVDEAWNLSPDGGVEFMAVRVPAGFFEAAESVCAALERMNGIESVKLDGHAFGISMETANSVPEQLDEALTEPVNPGCMNGPVYCAVPLDGHWTRTLDACPFQCVAEIRPGGIRFEDADALDGSPLKLFIEVDRKDFPKIAAAASPAEEESTGPSL